MSDSMNPTTPTPQPQRMTEEQRGSVLAELHDDGWCDYAEMLSQDIAALEAEAERMRPVVDAAVKWFTYEWQKDIDGMYQKGDLFAAFTDALEEYLASANARGGGEGKEQP